MKIERTQRWSIEWIAKDTYRALWVEFVIDGTINIKIPKWFVFDGSSVPNIAKVIWIDDDDYLYCAVLHDYLYRKKAKLYFSKDIWKYVKYFSYISVSKKYWYWKRKFADLCYKNSLLKWQWIKKKLTKRKVYYSYYILRLFWWLNFNKRDL